MSNNNKTPADAQPGGRVRLGDQAKRARFEAFLSRNPLIGLCAGTAWQVWQAALSAQPSPGGQDGLSAMLPDDARLVGVIADNIERGKLDHPGFYRNTQLAEALRRVLDAAQSGQRFPCGQLDDNDLLAALRGVENYLYFGDSNPIHTATVRAAINALAARQPVGVSTDTLRALADRWASDRDYTGSPVDDIRALIDEPTAARQPVGESVTDAGRSAAYDAIDRFLRNNMDDEAYADYVEHLEALWSAVPAKAAGQAPVAFDYPKFDAIGMGCGLEDRRIHFLIDAAQYGFDEALGQMKAILESTRPLYAAPPAQAVDLGQFRQPVQDWLDDAQASMEEHGDYDGVFGHAIEEGTRLLALIDSRTVETVDLERARDKGHDGAIRYVLGYLNGVGDCGSTAYDEILNACGRERIIRSAVEDDELEFTGLGRWVEMYGTADDRALIASMAVGNG